jgi:hypothetical protein
MPQPSDFIPMTGSVFASQDSEIIVNKQAVLSEHGQEVKTMLSRLPGDIAQSLLREYKTPTPEQTQSLIAAVAQRETVTQEITQGVNLDRSWLTGGDLRGIGIDEKSLGAVDDWINSPKPASLG